MPRKPRPPKLKPCPFCGAIPEIQPWHGGPPTKRMISCANEEDCAVAPMVCGDTQAEAARYWNRRAPLAPKGATHAPAYSAQ